MVETLTPEELVVVIAEEFRAHFSGPGREGAIWVIEEADRYRIVLDPCGSGGRMRKTELFGVTKKTYPWSWNKSGVPYYCIHCAVMWEIIPIELRGYPIRINLCPDRSEDPCVHLFYKRPQLIPEEYFTRVGKIKDISKFK